MSIIFVSRIIPLKTHAALPPRAKTPPATAAQQHLFNSHVRAYDISIEYRGLISAEYAFGVMREYHAPDGDIADYFCRHCGNISSLFNTRLLEASVNSANAAYITYERRSLSRRALSRRRRAG